MKRAGRESIVNIASIRANVTMAGMFPYAAAKSGMVGLTRGLALDYAPLGIRVNAILPGWTRTRLVEEWFAMQPDPAAAEARVLAAHPLRRLWHSTSEALCEESEGDPCAQPKRS